MRDVMRAPSRSPRNCCETLIIRSPTSGSLGSGPFVAMARNLSASARAFRSRPLPLRMSTDPQRPQLRIVKPLGKFEGLSIRRLDLAMRLRTLQPTTTASIGAPQRHSRSTTRSVSPATKPKRLTASKDHRVIVGHAELRAEGRALGTGGTPVSRRAIRRRLTHYRRTTRVRPRLAA